MLVFRSSRSNQGGGDAPDHSDEAADRKEACSDALSSGKRRKRHINQSALKTQVYCLFKWGGIRQYAQRNLSQVEEGERTTQISFVLVDFMALACTCLARHPDRIEEADAPELTDKPNPAVTHRGQEKIRSATEIKAT